MWLSWRHVAQLAGLAAPGEICLHKPGGKDSYMG
jgi:hypothetical protein